MTARRRTIAPSRAVALVLGLIVLFVGTGVGTSYALWSVQRTAGTTVTAGSIGISATPTAVSALSSAQVGLGTSFTAPITVKNTSATLALSYSAVLSGVETPSTGVIGDNIDFTAWVVASTSACTATTAISGTVGTTRFSGVLAGSTKLVSARALAIGASEVLCVRTTMKTSAPATVQGQSVAATVTVTGAAGWTTTAAATFTQSATAAPPAAFASCVTNQAGGSAVLTWAAAPTTLNGSSFKEYLIEWVYTSSNAVIVSTTRSDARFEPASTSLTGNTFVRVTLRYQNGWDATPTSYNFTRTSANSPKCSPEK